MLVSWVCVAFLGWLGLMGWAIVSLARAGFEPTVDAIEALSLKQAMAVSAFGDASLTAWLNQRITLRIRAQSARVLARAEEASGRLAQRAQAQMDARLWSETASMSPALTQTVNAFCLKAHQIWVLATLTGHLLMTKSAALVAAIPLFLLATGAGLVDGLNQRAIRTASLGRESTYVFHKSIPLARRALFWLLCLWLAIPHALSPTVVFVSLSVLLACLVSVAASRFKKYL